MVSSFARSPDVLLSDGHHHHRSAGSGQRAAWKLELLSRLNSVGRVGMLDDEPNARWSVAHQGDDKIHCARHRVSQTTRSICEPLQRSYSLSLCLNPSRASSGHLTSATSRTLKLELVPPATKIGASSTQFHNQLICLIQLLFWRPFHLISVHQFGFASVRFRGRNSIAQAPGRVWPPERPCKVNASRSDGQQSRPLTR